MVDDAESATSESTSDMDVKEEELVSALEKARHDLVLFRAEERANAIMQSLVLPTFFKPLFESFKYFRITRIIDLEENAEFFEVVPESAGGWGYAQDPECPVLEVSIGQSASLFLPILQEYFTDLPCQTICDFVDDHVQIKMYGHGYDELRNDRESLSSENSIEEIFQAFPVLKKTYFLNEVVQELLEKCGGSFNGDPLIDMWNFLYSLRKPEEDEIYCILSPDSERLALTEKDVDMGIKSFMKTTLQVTFADAVWKPSLDSMKATLDDCVAIQKMKKNKDISSIKRRISDMLFQDVKL